MVSQFRTSVLGLALVMIASTGAAAQESTLKLEKRVDKARAQVGDVLAFHVDAVNQTDTDYLHSGASGGVLFEDWPPKGFKLMAGSARIRTSAGLDIPAEVSKDGDQLIFGRTSPQGPVGVSLRAGQRIQLRYQMVVEVGTQPGRTYSNTASVRTVSGASLAEPVSAEVRVEAEAEFDEGLVLGQVFCDADGDGHLGSDEVGAGGVRVYADHGWYADTDPSGRFHLKKLKPGNHLFKIDPNTLPPGSKGTTPLKQLLYITPGFVGQLRFGVTCSFEVVQAKRLKTKEEIAREKRRVNRELESIVAVSGSVRDFSLSVDNRKIAPISASLTVDPPISAQEKKFKSGRRNILWNLGRTEDPLVFRIRSSMPDARSANWRLRVVQVEAEGERAVREFYGVGQPPTTVRWDGSASDGTKGVLKRGALYRARLHVFDGQGSGATSQEQTFGVSYGGDKGLLADKILRGKLFLRGKLGYVLKKVVKRLKRNVKLHPDLRISVEVHTDLSSDPSADLLGTQLSAAILKTYILETLELRSDRVQVRAFGSESPLGPNSTKKERAFNRRVGLRVYPPEEVASFKEPKSRPTIEEVSIQGFKVSVDAKGRFMRIVKRPEKNLLHLHIRRKDGRSTTALISLSKVKKKPSKKKKAKAKNADPLRKIGGEALKEAIDSNTVVILDPTEKKSTAANLTVRLPSKTATILTNRLFVSGQTDPSNHVKINGAEVHLSQDGAFAMTVPLPAGKSMLRIESLDPTGRQAQINWPVQVSDKEFFLLALADGAFGQSGAKLFERRHYHEVKLDDFFFAGRGALYFKGRISGTALFKDIFMTAHVDSTKDAEFSAFYEQVIDPHRDYAVFGDSSQDVQDATARGPFYVLVQADKSKLKFGSVRTDFSGVQLLRYKRTLNGGKLDFNHAFAEGYDTRIEAFASDDVKNMSRGHDELRATGGTLYYLSKGDLVEGSERLDVVVREMTTGMELARTSLVRDRDYRITVHDGRIMLNSPLPSTMDAMTSIGGTQPFNTSTLLKGHEVWIVADYESRSADSVGKLAWGAYGSQKLFGALEIGGGYLNESRVGQEAYRMLGAHLKLNYKKKTRAFIEFAESVNPDGVSLFSRDGGLHYAALSRAGAETHGFAFKGGLDSHLGELFDLDLNLRLKGYYQLIEPGFHSVGTVLEQGMEKYGGEVNYQPTSKDSAVFRADVASVRVEDTRFEGNFRTVKRMRFSGLYNHREGLWNVSGEGSFGQHRDDLDGLVQDSASVALGGGYKLSPRLRLLAIQEGILAGDPTIVGEDFQDHMLTHLGADWSLTDDFGLTAMTMLRWNGDHGIRMGVRSNLSRDSNLFLEERVMRDPGTGDLMYSTVFGARRSLGDGGQMYGEYRLDSGISGPANRAVLGLGQRFTLAEGIHLIGAYERAQTFGGFEGRGSRDVLSAGLNIIGSDWIKYGGRYEVRFDQGLASGDGADRIQVLLRNNLNLKLSPDVSALVFSTYTMTQNLTDRHRDQEALEVTGGLAYRPLHSNTLTMLARYTHRLSRGMRADLSPMGLESMVDWTNNIDLASVAGIIEMPYGLQLTEKLVYKHNVDSSGLGTETSTDQLLVINRFAVHLLERSLDIALEYRLMWALPDSELLHGALAEVAYTLYGYARLGVGYNFARFSADVMEDLSENKSGFFVRLTGTY